MRSNSLILSIRLLFVALTGYSFAASPIGVLQQEYNAAATKNHLEDVGGKATVSNLFDKALKNTKNKEFSQNFENIQTLTQYTQTLGNGACNHITQEDIFAVLYNASSSFRTMYRESLLPSQRDKENYSLPSVQACKKFIICSQDHSKDNYKHTPVRQTSCEEELESRYEQYNALSDTMTTFSDHTMNENIFQNGTIDDSDYDIMYDIARIGELFFVGFTPPTKTIFYQFPGNLSANNLPTPTTNNYNNNIGPGDFVSSMINQNIEEEEAATQNPGTALPGEISNDTSELDNNPIQGVSPVEQGISPIEQTITNFIQAVNQSPETPTTNPTNPTQTIPGNICIVPTVIEPIETQDPPQQVPDEIFQIYDQVLIEYAQTILAADTVDAIIGSNAIQPSVGDDDDDQVSQEEAANAVSSMIDAALGLDEPSQQCQAQCGDLPVEQRAFCQAGCSVNSCQSECSGLPPFDKGMCELQCLCKQVESGPLSDKKGNKIIPGGAFTVRFCQVPAQPLEIRKGASVFSIEDIVTEVRNILESMRRGGKLFKKVRAEEFLDSAMKKNSFGKMFVFNLQIATKPSYETTPAASYAKQLDAKSSANQRSMLGRHEDTSIPEERNKYLVIASPALQATKVEGAIDPGVFATQFQAQSQAASTLHRADEIVDITQLEKNAIMHESIATFLQNNLLFRQTVETYLVGIQGASQSLKNKIEKAK